jgi:peptide/nickel transport system substrate-binding protein
MKTKQVLAFIFTFILLFNCTACGSQGTASEEVSFKLAIQEEIDTFNPLSAWSIVSAEALMLVYDPLVRYDEAYGPVPCLATSWDVSDDQLTWTFHLAEDVKWSDGEPLTSADVKFTYETFYDQESYLYSSYLEGINSIETPDEYTVVVTTDYPKANMLLNTTPIVPEHIWGQIAEEELYTWIDEKVIGTGPFKYSPERSSEGVYVFVKNQDYFGEKKPFIDTLVLVLYENSDTIATALELGEIDAAAAIAPAQSVTLAKNENVELINAAIPGFSMVAINMAPEEYGGSGNPLLRDKLIRQALDYCVDREYILELAYSNAGTAGHTLINPGNPYHYEPTAEEIRGFDPAAAAQILEEAGYKDTNGDGIREDAQGNPLSFELINISDNSEEIKTAQIITSSARDAGIELRLTTMDSGALSDSLLAYDYDIHIWGWGADADPGTILSIFTTDYANETGFSNARYDELYSAQMEEMDEASRIVLVKEMQQILYDESPYLIYVHDDYVQAIRADRWTGYAIIPSVDGGLFYNLTYDNYMNLRPASAK